MSVATQLASTTTIALIGNPNTGKSTIFNALTGGKARVGNYPGVTVEHTQGECTVDGNTVQLLDLPGTYSLAAQSPDEMVAVDVLLNSNAQAGTIHGVLVVTDASNIQRNLYLVSQLLELKLPTVLVLNMMDVAGKRGMSIDADALASKLGIPVITTQANQSSSHNDLQRALKCLLHWEGDANPKCTPLPDALRIGTDSVQAELSKNGEPYSKVEALRILVDCEGEAAQRAIRDSAEAAQALAAIRGRVDKGTPLAAIEATSRYAWIRHILQGVVQKPDTPPRSFTDRVDAVLTHKLWGSLSFLALTMLIFQSIYAWSGPFMDMIDGLFGATADLVAPYIDNAMLQSLVIDGIIGGVGGVLIFLPQILILFAFIAVLEDCGYMARAAFLMDRVFARFGLSGKSFIPLLSSFACAIPGIMAARTIENRRDRLATILVAPLMSCSARLPVYTILIASFVPASTIAGFGTQGLTLFAMHLLGLVVAVPIVFALKKTVLRGPTPAFVMELPEYKRPSLRIVLRRVAEKGRTFVKRAGTIIFAMTLVIWALSYFPRPEAIGVEYDALRAAGAMSTETIDAAEASAYLEASALGQMGHFIEPAVAPLGWDWKIGTAAIASFPAREVIVSVLGVLYNLGDGVDDSSTELMSALQAATWPDGTPVFSLAVALSIMVFFALCCQCGATVATIKRETNSWGWASFAFIYMTVLAYVGAWAAYRIVSHWPA